MSQGITQIVFARNRYTYEKRVNKELGASWGCGVEPATTKCDGLLRVVVMKNYNKTDDEVGEWYKRYLENNMLGVVEVTETHEHYLIESPGWSVLFLCEFPRHKTAALTLYLDQKERDFIISRREPGFRLSNDRDAPNPLADTFYSLENCSLSAHITNRWPHKCFLDKTSKDYALGYKYKFEWNSECTWLEIDGNNPAVIHLLKKGIPLLPVNIGTTMSITTC